MARVAITKMHGAGNDFIVVDRRTQWLDDVAAFARWACDRKNGIGADGLLTIERSYKADVLMRVVNADGSEAEMCGNGIRCVARFLDEANDGDAHRIETASGTIEATVVAEEPEYRVRVAIGHPQLEMRDLRLTRAQYVDVGNPHVVLIRDTLDRGELLAAGEALQRDVAFPHGTNVHVMALVDDHAIEVLHFERGVGETRACGTGAVACAATAIVHGMAQSPVTVHVPGGELLVEWDGVGVAYLTGPAERVFDMSIDLDAIALD